jgi:nuclear pore complex protein Nup205
MNKVTESFFPHFLLVQITFSLLFSLVIAFISDALSAVPDKGSILSHDASFRKEFHEIVR